MDLRKTGIDGANWIRLPQDRVQWWAFVSTVMNHKESRQLIDNLSDFELFKEFPAPWSKSFRKSHSPHTWHANKFQSNHATGLNGKGKEP
jgi:hypothetical protein